MMLYMPATTCASIRQHTLLEYPLPRAQDVQTNGMPQMADMQAYLLPGAQAGQTNATPQMAGMLLQWPPAAIEFMNNPTIHYTDTHSKHSVTVVLVAQMSIKIMFSPLISLECESSKKVQNVR